jgi:hypothetical protein
MVRAPVLAVVLTAALGAAEDPAAALLARVAAAATAPALRQVFVQEQRLDLLPEPVLTPGAIEIDRIAGTLRWSFADGPVLLLAGGRIRRWGPDGREEVVADAAVQAMGGQMQAMLSGDWTPLGRLFAAPSASGAEAVVFRARDPDLARFVAEVEAGFADDGSLRRLVLRSVAGDRTEYRFAAPEPGWRPARP